MTGLGSVIGFISSVVTKTILQILMIVYFLLEFSKKSHLFEVAFMINLFRKFQMNNFDSRHLLLNS
jgi:hypothetical protein